MTPPFFVMPLDSRPVCYDFVLDLAAVAGLNVHLPPRNLLGHLKQAAPYDALFDWSQATLDQNPNAAVILALDTIVYGGLISSRVNLEPLEDLTARRDRFFSHLRATHHPRYGFSSILRIPAYNNNEEEPDYWAQYGALLYQISAATHQQGGMPEDLLAQVPDWVVHDFLTRREKNFSVNQSHFKLLESGALDFLAFCQDDTGPYGLNVQEGHVLSNQIRGRKLDAKAVVQTGADELALTLLARALWRKSEKPLKVFPWVFPDHGRNSFAKFDGVPCAQVVARNLHTLGATACVSPWDADLILLVNAPTEEMGDHMTQEVPLRPKAPLNELMKELKTWLPQKPVAIADIVYANGGDPMLLKALAESNLPLEKLAGYAAWNTPGNTIGSVLAMAAVNVWAQRQGVWNETAHRKLLLKRFIDDGLYQGDMRSRLRMQVSPGECPGADLLNNSMEEGVAFWQQRLHVPDETITLDFPCNRLFEVSVTMS